jgi:catechol 2,3-dioxygenase-like lactoylglutathione lyase family enzyme
MRTPSADLRRRVHAAFLWVMDARRERRGSGIDRGRTRLKTPPRPVRGGEHPTVSEDRNAGAREKNDAPTPTIRDRFLNCGAAPSPPLEPPVTKITASLLVCVLAGYASTHAAKPATSQGARDARLRLGNFSVSLAVKDLAASRAFYEKLGFHAIGGDATKNWLILQNGASTIGLFHGPAFTRNVLTFNPGWDSTAKPLADFDDVRDIQRTLKSRGLVPAPAADESSSGPASLMLADPDGNPILIDQHVPRPRK